MPDSNTFGDLLRELRLNAGYGLRRFATMIGEQPSNLSATETGKRPPWRTRDKLERAANALALVEGTPEWDHFFIAAGKKSSTLPESAEAFLDNRMCVALMRTVDELQLTEKDLEKVVQYIRRMKTGSPKRGKPNSTR